MLKTLLAVRLRSFSSAMLGKGERKIGRTVLFVILYIYVAVALVGMSTLMSVMMGSALLPLGLGKIFLSVFLLADVAIIFVMSVFETKSTLFDCKDNELLLSMPIKPRDIMLSRVISVLIFNLAASVVIMLPAAIVYTVLSGELFGFFGALMFMLLVPFPATAISAAFGYLIAYISKRTRYNTLITVLFTLAFLAVYFYFYMQLMSSDGEMLENPETLLAAIEGMLPFLAFLGRAITFSPLELGLLLVGFASVSAITYALLSRYYLSIATDGASYKKTVYVAKRAKRSSVLTALIKKEFSKITSSSLYLMNAGIGTVMRIFIGVFAVVKSAELRALLTMLLSEMGGVSYDSLVALGASVAIVMLSSMDMFSASAVSLEGKSFWIIKSMPVNPKAVLISKTLAHAIIAVAASLISSSLLLIALGAGIISWLIVIPVSIVSALTFAIFGTVINVALPKLEFENEAQVVKQSLATFVTMFAQMLWGFVLLLPAFLGIFALGGYLTALLILLLHLIVCTALYIVLTRVSVRVFANL